MTKLLMPLILLATVIAAAAQTPAPAPHDHGQLTARGEKAMGFDQNATIHHFYLYEDGGEIEVTVKDKNDAANIAAIRAHLPHISKMFAAGDFSMPHFIHAENVPGSDGMKRLRDRIGYAYADLPGGGRVRITTRHASALSAVHEFLKYQITDHKTGDALQITAPKHK